MWYILLYLPRQNLNSNIFKVQHHNSPEPGKKTDKQLQRTGWHIQQIVDSIGLTIPLGRNCHHWPKRKQLLTKERNSLLSSMINLNQQETLLLMPLQISKCWHEFLKMFTWEQEDRSNWKTANRRREQGKQRKSMLCST